MIDKADNKMMTGKDIKNKTVQTEPYLFPEHGVTVEASSQEEAHQKLQEILTKKEK